QIPWGHNLLILTKIKDQSEAIFYIQQTLINNWSRSILAHHIQSQLFQRKGALDHNFPLTLPEAQSDLAEQTLKSPYILDFLQLDETARERDLQRQLTHHITSFLLELGKGFAFVGQEYELKLGNRSNRLDLLFYHLKLRAYIVIELKMTAFQPEYAGKMNYYLNAVDDLLKTDVDNSSIGLILCRSKDQVVVEYALRGITKPMGISEYQLIQSLPKDLASSLPTIGELEQELKRYDEEN
ncbi:MAG: PDDEXK nuclease domain-containing protein, partial [Bacteroidota bacterium]